jgi:SAM-dependent methyltransferase
VTRQSGAARIFLYNWPVYAAAWTIALAMLWLSRVWGPPLSWAAALAAAVAVAWSVGSILVSFYVYDRSALVSGRWIPPLLGSPARTWATIHAGLDAEVELDAVLEGACVARLDIFDACIMTSGSIARARARTPSVREASSCSPTSLALESEACDAIVVAFTAHEIRDRRARETFFDELYRSLRPGGRVLIVEHLCDLANFLAYGPGCFHFVSRREWLRLAAHAKLAVSSETRVTPWVMALALERPR